MSAYRQTLALTDGKELGPFVLSRHAGVGMGLVPGLFDVLFARAVGFGLEMQVAVVQSCSEGLELGVAVRLTLFEYALLEAVQSIVGIVVLEDLNHLTFNAF